MQQKKATYPPAGRHLLALTLALLSINGASGEGYRLLTIKNYLTTMKQQTDLLTTKEAQYFTTGDGQQIAFKLDGPEDAPVLILSNSIATNFRMWEGQIPAFTQHFRILRFDTRGHGSSDAPAGNYSIARMGWDVIELMNHLNIQHAHFCGLSLGGFIGQWLAIHAPDRINRLVLANTSSHLGPQAQWNEHIISLNAGASMHAYGDMFIGNWFPQKMIEARDSTVSKFRKMVLDTSPQGLAGSFAAVRDTDLRRTITLIPNPTLVIGGAYDGVTLPEHSEEIAASIPGARLVILPVVHLSNVENSDDFERLVIDFLLTDD
ncbi:alpha/beta fold hydrolase [Fulvivirga ulvae]|uniref:alpha/beta fold hydrolase n=1 Tax=Fulvivirga ulvae TaxID=2904245 RepID=UPI001F375897|nr:alpha/beta fold hydrolase [Fulvivirga ulvae]UII31714.1 alpha/beta fold hydrolase [Fulvivirga ulvae]